MGMAEIRIAEPERRDRLLLISAFAMVVLTMLGAAGESLGRDRLLKSNTSKTRTHSLFRQGCMLYELIPNMPEHRLLPLIQRFAEMLVRKWPVWRISVDSGMRGRVRSMTRLMNEARRRTIQRNPRKPAYGETGPPLSKVNMLRRLFWALKPNAPSQMRRSIFRAHLIFPWNNPRAAVSPIHHSRMNGAITHRLKSAARRQEI
jgi:hypothetical protein